MPAIIYSDAKSNDLFPLRVGATTFLGPKKFTAEGVSQTPLTIQRLVGHTANLTEWQTEAGTVVASISPTGVGKFGLDAQAHSGARTVITTDNATATGLRIIGAASQTADIFQVQNSAGFILNAITPDGTMFINAGSATYGYGVRLIPTIPASRGLVIQGAPAQTANLQEWRDTNSNVLSAINSAGKAIGAGFSKTIRISHTFTIPGEVKVASGDTDFIPGFFVPVPSGQTVTYQGLRMYCTTGSVVYQLRKNGVNMFGGTTSATATNNSSPYGVGGGTPINNEDSMAIVVQSVSGTPKNLSVSLYLDYTV